MRKNMLTSRIAGNQRCKYYRVTELFVALISSIFAGIIISALGIMVIYSFIIVWDFYLVTGKFSFI
jgi:hypothetical protein